MTQEEKQILIIDLCARTPYGVNVTNGNGILKLTTRTDITFVVNNGCLPYLRPMSSMTGEEKKEFDDFTFEVISFNGQVIEAYQLLDWLNAHHFDYRGLIEKGLALEAPKGMYKEN